MSPLIRPPRSAILRPLVASLSDVGGALPPMLERVLPSAHIHLMVNLDEDEFRTFLSESAKIPPKLAKTIVLPKWTGEVDADSVANTAQLMQKYGVIQGEIDPSKLLQGG